MRKAVPRRQLQAGYTLLEVVVVIAIIGVLTAFALPRLKDAMSRGHDSPGLVDGVTISNALEQYFTDNGKYPNALNASTIMRELRGAYLKLSPSFRNGYDQGYLYLTSSTRGKGFWLIDLRGEKQDDDPGTNGQQIKVRCTVSGYPTEHRTFTVQPDLAIPTTWVSDNVIDNCELLNPNPNIKMMTHFR